MGEVITLLFSKSGVLCCVAVLTLIQVERKKQSRCVFLRFACMHITSQIISCFATAN